jgi:hypothetical protein
MPLGRDPKSNHLLAALPETEWNRWLPELEWVKLPLGEVLWAFAESASRAPPPSCSAPITSSTTAAR